MTDGTVGAVSADVWNQLADEMERISDALDRFGNPEIGTRWFKVTSNAGGAGIYNGKSLTGWAGPVDPGSNLVIPDSGESLASSEDVVIENDVENGNSSGHIIPRNTFVPGWYTGQTDDSTNKPIVRVRVPHVSVDLTITGTNAGAGYPASIAAGVPDAPLTNVAVIPVTETGTTYSGLSTGSQWRGKIIDYVAGGTIKVEVDSTLPSVGQLGCGATPPLGLQEGTIATSFYKDDFDHIGDTFGGGLYWRGLYWSGFDIQCPTYSGGGGIIGTSDLAHAKIIYLTGTTPVPAAGTGGTTNYPVKFSLTTDNHIRLDPGACSDTQVRGIIDAYVTINNPPAGYTGTITVLNCSGTAVGSSITTLKFLTDFTLSSPAAGEVDIAWNGQATAPITLTSAGTCLGQKIGLAIDTSALAVTSGQLTTVGDSGSETVLDAGGAHALTISGSTVTVTLKTKVIPYYNGLKHASSGAGADITIVGTC